MFKKALFAATLFAPVLVLSGTAYAGNTNWAPTKSTIEQQTAPHVALKHPGGFECRYQGGPKFPMLHVRT
ncbi:hypothetical protein [Rhodoplanes azumiensis]|uniref:Uncharacterized protein n=1 Tax=Rhodoplanes azumiensis TaxID=1897628 RepID=A0ABW5AIJ2_9BRAD